MEGIPDPGPTCEVRADGCDSRAPVALDRAHRRWCCPPCWASLAPIPDRVKPDRLEAEFPRTVARMKWRSSAVPDPMA